MLHGYDEGECGAHIEDCMITHFSSWDNFDKFSCRGSSCNVKVEIKGWEGLGGFAMQHVMRGDWLCPVLLTGRLDRARLSLREKNIIAGSITSHMRRKGN